VALRRATLAVGGKATGSHAHRRTAAVEEKNARYRDHVKHGKNRKNARRLAVEETVEHLGHSRHRKDQAAAYLRRGLKVPSAFEPILLRISRGNYARLTLF